MDRSDRFRRFLVAFQDAPEALPAVPQDSYALSNPRTACAEHLAGCRAYRQRFLSSHIAAMALFWLVHSWILHILSSGTWWFDWFDSSKAGENPLTVNRYPVMMQWKCRFIESCFTSRDSWFLSATGSSMLRLTRWLKKSLQSSWQSRCCSTGFVAAALGALVSDCVTFESLRIWENSHSMSTGHWVISGLAECIRCSVSIKFPNFDISLLIICPQT